MARARLERDGDVGVLVLDDPPLNLFGREMVADILAALEETDGVRALLVRAEGDYFTGGADVNVFDGLSAADAEQFVAELLAVTHRIEELPFPTLAAVQGLCLTAGLELSLACDLIWAAEPAQFGLVEAVVGAHAADGRHAAHRRARRPRAGARVRDERRPQRRRHPRALECAQPRAPRGPARRGVAPLR